VKKGFVPSSFVFQNIITACKQADPVEVDRAILVLEEMRKQSIKPDVKIYNSIIDTCRIGGAWRRAAHLFQSMYKNDNVDPNAQTCVELTSEEAWRGAKRRENENFEHPQGQPHRVN